METITRPEVLSGAAAIAEAEAQTPRRREYSPQMQIRMAEALDIFSRACTGNLRALADLQEALSTSDFSYVFGNVLDRELMSQYEQLSPIWPAFARRALVKDFRQKQWVDLLGGRGILEKVPELAPYPQRKPTDGQYTLQVAKYGGGFSLSWEDIINDDLSSLQDLPSRLAQGARDTEDYLATQQLTDGTGPNDALFGATAIDGTTSNLISGNPALSTTALSAAMAAVGQRKDSEGRPVMVSGYVLVVPPGLEVDALNIVNANSLILGADSAAVRSNVDNWLRNKVTVVVDPWLTVIDTSGNAATTWYLLPKPSTPRPAVVLGFLRGHETPDIRVKSDAGQAIGGGQLPATEGSFDNDDIRYRARHVLGGTPIDPRYVAVSNGSGS